MNSSIQMRDEMCLMNVRRKVGFDPTTVECCSTVDLSGRRHSGTMPCETRNVSWRLHTMLCKTSLLPWREGHDVETSQ